MSDYQRDLEKYANPEPVQHPARPKENKFRPKPDPILLKLYPDPHPLSSEEQIFFIKLTEGAFGFNEHVRNETLQTLSRDYQEGQRRENLFLLTRYLGNSFFIASWCKTNLLKHIV
jgi:hypothetical protein